jgi:mannobiose 2-epimerase
MNTNGRLLSPLAEVATRFDQSLRSEIMPYWYDTTLDRVNGGYHVADKYRTLRTLFKGLRYRLTARRQNSARAATSYAGEKHIVSQMRLLWGFSQAHQRGYSESDGTTSRNYLDAATHGYCFLIERMLDPQEGGVYWKVDRAGRVLDSRKLLFGQSFAIYALVEYYRASGSAEALAHARELFQTVQRKMYDDEHRGWEEHTDAQFHPLPREEQAPLSNLIEWSGPKSCYAHMHWMEALTELYVVTGDASVRGALQEVLEINTTLFFTPDVTATCQFRTPDWKPLTEAGYHGFYPGYQLEFIWLMIRAQQVCGVAPAWEHFETLLRHAVEYGFDHTRGGFYWRGEVKEPAFDTTKVWWVQAEGLAALTERLTHQPNEYYAASLGLLVKWIWSYQRLPDGIWVWSTDARGEIKNRTKASSWKAAYHDVRGIVKFIEAFSPKPGSTSTSSAQAVPAKE